MPRYVSLKFGEVNGRQGPSEDDKLLWTYHAKGLPVQIIAETAEWRRIIDLNLMACLYTCKAAVPPMRAQGG